MTEEMRLHQLGKEYMKLGKQITRTEKRRLKLAQQMNKLSMRVMRRKLKKKGL